VSSFLSSFDTGLKPGVNEMSRFRAFDQSRPRFRNFQPVSGLLTGWQLPDPLVDGPNHLLGIGEVKLQIGDVLVTRSQFLLMSLPDRKQLGPQAVNLFSEINRVTQSRLGFRNRRGGR